MHIRDFRIEDYEAVTDLWAEAGLPFRPDGRDRRDRIARELAGGQGLFLVAVAGDRLVGVVLGTHDGRKGWINRLAVASDSRRQGVARALVEEVEARLQLLGIAIVACLIEGENESSQALFAELGYVRHPEIVYHAKRFVPDA